MKNSLKLVLAVSVLTAFLACKKDTTPFFVNGTVPVLSSSVKSIAATPADSLGNVVAFSWTSPQYSTSQGSVKYIIQMDSSGRGFSKAVSFTVFGVLSDTFTAKQINDVLLGFGFSFGVAYNVDVRLISSYANNNEQYTSVPLTLQMTPYKVPPKVAPPDSSQLYIIGGATIGGWNQPVPVPLQKFTRVDSVTYQGTFYLTGGGAYDLLPVNGSWSTKYNVANNSVPGISAGGDFQFSTGPGNDIPAPAKTGIYTILVNFQSGKFTVTPVNVFSFIYAPGDYQGWSPSTAPALASINSDGNYEGYVNITTTGGFKFTSEQDWNGTNYGDTAANGQSGILNAGGGNNLNIPATGYYKINASTSADTWSGLATTWSLIGGFAASGWSTDIPMTYNAASNSWKGTITTAVGDQFKFRANGAWTLNYGDNNGNGTLQSGGANINAPATAGSHTITLNLSIPGYYYYTIQ